jgi:hypothetical protein
MYVRCINNKQFIQHPDFEDDDIIHDLTIGHIYKVIPDEKEEDLGYLRIIDNSGEDYTFPVSYFESVELTNTCQELGETVTVHLSGLEKAILRAEALAANKSMSALIREWIRERLHQQIATDASAHAGSDGDLAKQPKEGSLEHGMPI